MARFDKVLVTSPPEHRFHIQNCPKSWSKLFHLLQQLARPALNPPFHKFHSLCTIGDEAHNIACNIVKELKWATGRHARHLYLLCIKIFKWQKTGWMREVDFINQRRSIKKSQSSVAFGCILLAMPAHASLCVASRAAETQLSKQLAFRKLACVAVADLRLEAIKRMKPK